MARNRQQAKQRQAERRARRLAQGGDGRRSADARKAPPEVDDRVADAPPVGDDREAVPGIDDPRVPPPGPGIDPELAVGAPPSDEGRSDAVIADEPYLDPDEHLTEEEVEAEAEAEARASGTGEAGYEVRGRRGRSEAGTHKERPRVVQFLIAVWAELQRVQWPNRQALTTLTGVVLGFVLIAGGYLGLLDAIFSEIIQAIL